MSDITNEMSEGAEELRVNYGNRVIVLPASVLSVFQSAKKSDLYILLNLLAEPEASVAVLAERCSSTPEAVDSALAFWRGAGILTLGEPIAVNEESTSAKPQRASAAKKAASPVLPEYSSTDIAEIVEKDRTVALMIDECERAFGKIFRTSETAKLLALRDYLGLSPDYISTLCAYCARIGKKSVRYLETTALSLYDGGICDTESLDGFIKTAELRAQLEGQIRALFGMNMTRELTTREKKYIESWVSTFGYGMDEIRMAYEITVDKINEPSLSYANAILERWHADGLKTADQIREHNEKESAERGVEAGKSFDSDDFFEAALRRSYADSASAPEAPTTGKRTRKKSNKPNN